MPASSPTWQPLPARSSTTTTAMGEQQLVVGAVPRRVRRSGQRVPNHATTVRRMVTRSDRARHRRMLAQLRAGRSSDHAGIPGRHGSAATQLPMTPGPGNTANGCFRGGPTSMLTSRPRPGRASSRCGAVPLGLRGTPACRPRPRGGRRPRSGEPSPGVPDPARCYRRCRWRGSCADGLRWLQCRYAVAAADGRTRRRVSRRL